MELFGQFGEYECGEIICRPKARGDERPLVPHTRTPVAGVEIKQRVVLSGVLEKPGLDPASAADTRAVLASCAEFEVRRPCGPRQFRWLWFNHPLFKGRGDFLLRWVGVERSNAPYYTWLGRLYPALLADFAAGWLTMDASSGDRWCEEDVAAIVRLIEADKICRERVGDILLALAGTRAALDPNPESLAIRRDAVEKVVLLLERLQPRERGVLEMRFGLGGEAEMTWREIGERCNVGKQRVSQIAAGAMWKLRRWMIRTDKGLLSPRGCRK